MHKRHRTEWDKLRADHADRRAAINARAKAAVAKVRAEIQAARLPAWRQMNKQHFAELRQFKEREQRLTGKIHNAIAAIKSMGAVRGDASAQGFLGNAFNYLTSAAKREAALTQRQHVEKRDFAAAQRREVQAKAATIRTERQQQQRDNVKRLGNDVAALRNSQEADRQNLRNEWRERNTERGSAWSKVKASRDMRRQVSERFAGQGRDSGTRDRGH
jgi:hypothetical protein